MFSRFRPSTITAIRSISRKPTGRRTSATTETPGSSAFFKYSDSKVFARQYLMRFGKNTVDDAILILNPGAKVKMRRLDEKKRKQLSLLYFENVSTILGEFAEVADAGVVITKVDAPNHLKELKIFWQAFGDERDIKITEVLQTNAEGIRKRLSETMYHSNVPSLNFIPDRSQIVIDEMNRIFEAADYGMQYRALSHTGAVLGSQKDSGTPNPEKISKVPRFILAKREKIEERKRQLAEETEANSNS